MTFKKTTILIIILLFVSFVLLFFYWKYGIKENMDNKSKANIMLFYADWCPYCKSAKPEWEKVKDKYEGKTINGYKLMFDEYDDKNKEMMDKYDINSFPTIKIKKDNDVYNFSAKANEQNITEFINSVII